jgi:phenylacetate-CoA ligase
VRFERLYANAPVWAQNLMCGVYGGRLARRRYGRAYASVERDVLARDRGSADELYEYQCRRLRRLVDHAAARVPYYRELFARLGLTAADIRRPEDLAALPVLSKSTVQERLGDFSPDTLGAMETTTVHTSGTTGTGLVFPMMLAAEREQWATWWRYRGRFGLDHRTWYAHFYGRSVVPQEQSQPPFWRVNRPGRQILFSGYHMREEFLGAYVDELNRRRPPWLQGYPSLLAVLAGYVLASGRRLAYRPRAVTTGAETLLASQRRLIEEAFVVPCHQHYGMTEAVGNISECEHGRLHVDEDFGYLEFLPLGGGAHRVVATGWANEAFVLLRYDLGDTVTLPPSHAAPCPCGRAGRVVESIDGRIEDYVVTPDGDRLGRLDHIFKDMVNIRECQIVQEEVGRVDLHVVRGPHFTEHDAVQLLREARSRLGAKMDVCLTFVPQLERSRAGKLRLVVSRLPQGRLAAVAFGESTPACSVPGTRVPLAACPPVPSEQHTGGQAASGTPPGNVSHAKHVRLSVKE